MPLDSFANGLRKSLLSSFQDRAVWERKISLWPRRCVFSGKRIWLRRGRRGTATWFGPGEPAVEIHWADEQEYIMWLLTR